jgi:DNA-binding PadR family transcriptional regulator
MDRASREANRFLPLSPQDFHVLLVVKDEPRHGYGIVRAAEEQFSGNLGLDIGTLYRIVARLLEWGLIHEVKPKIQPPSDGRKRRFYQATKLGVRVARAETERLQALLRSPQAADLLESK